MVLCLWHCGSRRQSWDLTREFNLQFCAYKRHTGQREVISSVIAGCRERNLQPAHSPMLEKSLLPDTPFISIYRVLFPWRTY